MAAYRRVLVPTDFSEPSRRALTAAAEWARAFDGTLHVLHVVPLNGIGQAEAEKALESWVPAALAPLVSGKAVERALAPELGILEAAQRVGADLIALSTHGRSGFKHVMIGSVAERVVQLATCPVLTFRDSEHAFERP